MRQWRRSTRSRRARVLPIIELLQPREMMSASVRTFDGTGNNLSHTTWGSINVDLLRKAAAAYADGISAPAGTDRPSAREISNVIASHGADDMPNDRNMSAFVYLWGQFIDHDLDLTNAATPTENFDVQVPTGDPQFDINSTGDQTIGLTRSVFDTNTGVTTPRQQVNTITAFIDGSMVYGSDATRAAALRTFAGGKLKTSDGNLLPFNTDGLANANDAHIFPDNQLFLAGDVRANENIELTAIQTLFMREHNRLAALIAKSNHKLTDEQIYQKARSLVIGEIESITYNEFLPALLGTNAVAKYTGYKSSVNPSISTEFSTAAFRLGHSMLENDVEFLDNATGQTTQPEIPLAMAFFNPGVVEQTGLDPILKYLATTKSEEIDNKIVDGVRNFLFGPPGAGGFDLASLNIQRGRDHGLADYNSTREAMGLPRVTSFSQISSDPAVQQQLQTLYGSVDNVDLWVGGLAEDHVAGGSVGETFRSIIVDQFTRTRDGDRFWYQRSLSKSDRKLVDNTSLADIISRNTGVSNVQSDVFYFDISVRGKVFADRNGDGQRGQSDYGLGGWTVQLLDTSNTVVQTTTTAKDGSYLFDNLEVGTYHVQVDDKTGWTLTNIVPQNLVATRGIKFTNVNIGEKNKTVVVVQNRPVDPSHRIPPSPPVANAGDDAGGVGGKVLGLGKGRNGSGVLG